LKGVWRLCRRPFAHNPLDGEGARRFGGRWNSAGIPAVYTSEHISLAALEMLVHIDPDLAPDDWVLIEIELPATAPVRTLSADALPPNWRSYPAPAALQALGDAWLRSADDAALKVPSVIVPEDSNLLLNPCHPALASADSRIIRDFVFDTRLL